jgi:transcriptional regulator with XRE-family HTH domain
MSRLKELRKTRGFTQVQMQMMTGIDQSDYSKIESGIIPLNSASESPLP